MERLGLLAEWGFVLTAIVAVILYVLNRFHGHYGEIPLKDRVQNGDWAHLIAEYSQPRREGYFAAIGRLLHRVERIWGPRWSGQALARSFQIAYIYPLIAVLIAWVWGNADTLGGLPFFPTEYEAFWDRAWRGASLVGVMGVSATTFFLAFAFFDHVDEFIKNRNADGFGRKRVFLSKAPPWSLRLLQFGAVALAGVVVVAVGFFGAGAFAFAIAIAGALTGSIAISTAGALALVVSGAFTAAVVIANPVDATIFVLFLSALPLLNAFFDWVSYSATRHFLGQLDAAQDGKLDLVALVVIDICVGLACLAGLILSFVMVSSTLAWVAPEQFIFDWRAYWAAAQAGEPGFRLPLYLMAGTTLLPTFVHMGFGLVGVFRAGNRRIHRAVAMMQDMQRDPNAHDPNRIIREIRRGRFAAVIWAALFLLTLFAAIGWGVLHALGLA